MSLSIKDIARLAGVSHSTVSRALRSSPLIPQATRERIQKIAQEQGYSASAIARSLVTRKTQAVGVVVTSIADPFNGEVVSGLEETANQSGYSVVLATSQANPEREMAIVRSFAERRVDGLIVASSRVGAPYLERLSDLRLPIVLLNNQAPGQFKHSVRMDNVHGAAAATRHLIELGHTRIAYLGNSSGMQTDVERCQGYEQALMAEGVRPDLQLIVREDGAPGGFSRRAAALFRLPHPPTALFCYNDIAALGVLQAARHAGIRIPQKLSVCGFDDLFFTAYLEPPLTTVCQPKRRLGQVAMKLLIDLISGSEVPEREIVLEGELVIRGSTAAPARAR